jgi:hypothetical protein
MIVTNIPSTRISLDASEEVGQEAAAGRTKEVLILDLQASAAPQAWSMAFYGQEKVVCIF